ncbi:hypothetical protein BDK51DRAFT_34492 [Blyttiomyces helicus]|uniref:Uncharacterized protein n=1 Tax=Blyttiomyces helicus TaxID=388810 RepID=A0A4P9VWQ3_9FUNG|nr:hypothetical protein BDK51DRAFT_34492 [Blyttiomyces helicus]|eukprot:RKO84141.1 hypothetical protein BDK51DRAFT_34492 [Blyttiomyces helicus]
MRQGVILGHLPEGARRIEGVILQLLWRHRWEGMKDLIGTQERVGESIVTTALSIGTTLPIQRAAEAEESADLIAALSVPSRRKRKLAPQLPQERTPIDRTPPTYKNPHTQPAAPKSRMLVGSITPLQECINLNHPFLAPSEGRLRWNARFVEDALIDERIGDVLVNRTESAAATRYADLGEVRGGGVIFSVCCDRGRGHRAEEAEQRVAAWHHREGVRNEDDAPRVVDLNGHAAMNTAGDRRVAGRGGTEKDCELRLGNFDSGHDAVRSDVVGAAARFVFVGYSADAIVTEAAVALISTKELARTPLVRAESPTSAALQIQDRTRFKKGLENEVWMGIVQEAVAMFSC